MPNLDLPRPEQAKAAITREEKARYRRLAKAGGLLFSEWIRRALRAQADREERQEKSE